MKLFFVNAALFLLGYLPLTLIVGLIGGFFDMRGVEEAFGYSVFLWLTVMLQLLVPTVLALLVAYALVAWATQRIVRLPTRTLSVVLVGGGIAAIQALAWGGSSFSWAWLIVAVLPACWLGWALRYPPIAARQDQSQSH